MCECKPVCLLVDYALVCEVCHVHLAEKESRKDFKAIRLYLMTLYFILFFSVYHNWTIWSGILSMKVFWSLCMLLLAIRPGKDRVGILNEMKTIDIIKGLEWRFCLVMTSICWLFVMSLRIKQEVIVTQCVYRHRGRPASVVNTACVNSFSKVSQLANEPMWFISVAYVTHT